MHVVPAMLPNGRPFTPEVFLDDRTVLVRTEKDGNADKMDGLWAYDVKARTARLLVRVTPPPKTVITTGSVPPTAIGCTGGPCASRSAGGSWTSGPRPAPAARRAG